MFRLPNCQGSEGVENITKVRAKWTQTSNSHGKVADSE